MFFGIELHEFVRFLTQLSIVVVASASLWGFVFLWKARKTEGQSSMNLRKLAAQLFPLILAGFFVFATAWLVLITFLLVPGAEAHEGMVLRPDIAHQVEYVQRGVSVNIWAAALLALSIFVSFFTYAKKRSVFEKYGHVFFGIQLVLASIIILFMYATGPFDRTQIFFWLHNWHSVLTVGTVVVLDVLYMATFLRDDLKRVLYPIFPAISAVIFIGLGIDFGANFLVFKEAFQITEQFMFSQTLVGILIINGVLLSIRINDKLLGLIREDRILSLSPRMSKIAGLAGAISIVSWLSITFVDFFELTLSYIALMTIYVLAIGMAYVIHGILESVLLKLSKNRVYVMD